MYVYDCFKKWAFHPNRCVVAAACAVPLVLLRDCDTA